VPIYEYHCLACGEEFEKLVYGPSPRTQMACPACTSDDVSRVLSRFGMRGGGGPVAGSAGGGCACASGGGCGCR